MNRVLWGTLQQNPFCMTKRNVFCPFYFSKMGRWRLRKANRHNPKGIKGESETSPFSSYIVI
ncbi:hypothetical protein ET005_11165, partial [Lactococcus petauri]|nr:hypothetical protein [Lactococcus petauri]